jgi:hypothetical protein
MRIYLYGYLGEDVLGRVIVTPDERTVSELAGQLCAWGGVTTDVGSMTVQNEAGEPLAPDVTLTAAGLSSGDIFTLSWGAVS